MEWCQRRRIDEILGNCEVRKIPPRIFEQVVILVDKMSGARSPNRSVQQATAYCPRLVFWIVKERLL
jgi:hypothetical protein